MANYAVPPWLIPRGEDPANAYISAYHAGAAVAGEQARLNQESNNTALQLQVKQQEMEQEHMRQQQMLEMQKAYKDAEIGLRKSELDQTAQRVQLATDAAARRYTAQQQYSQMLARGVSPDQAMLKLAPSLFNSASGVAALTKSVEDRMKPAFDPEVIQKTAPDGTPITMAQLGDRRYTVVRPQNSESGVGPLLDKSGRPVPGMMRVDGKPRMVPHLASVTAAQNVISTLEKDPAFSRYFGTTNLPPVGSTGRQRYEGQLNSYNRAKQAIKDAEAFNNPSDSSDASDSTGKPRLTWHPDYGIVPDE